MFFQDRKIKYSIRKLSVATVSLAIGFLFAPAALGAAQVAQADELTATEQVENKAENQVSVVSSATEQAESQKESQVALKSAAPAATGEGQRSQILLLFSFSYTLSFL